MPPIPVPASRQGREFRIRFLPVVVFVGTLAVVAILWNQQAPRTALPSQFAETSAQVSVFFSAELPRCEIVALKTEPGGKTNSPARTTVALKDTTHRSVTTASATADLANGR